MINGILVINKERGITSHQVVANLRRIFKQSRIGHSGTLDPEATGVLVVGIGEGTRCFQYLDEDVKVYRAEIILGQTTDTQDATGKIIGESLDFSINREEIELAFKRLSGEVDQIPPMYSAVKVNGKKLYELARQGMEIERRSRKINVLKWVATFNKDNYGFKDRFVVEIFCSKGTYIRTLIHDLGIILGCGAHMGSLVRLKAGNFLLEQALTIAEVEEQFATGILHEKLLSVNDALSHLPCLVPENEDIGKLANGGKISFDKYRLEVSSGSYARAIDPNCRVIAILSLKETETHRYWQPEKVFHSKG